MKTTLSKFFLLLFAFAFCVNSVFAQLSVSLSYSSYNSGPNISCFGGADGWVTATPSGGTSPYTYQWSNSATTQTINNVSASYYEVTVTDANSNTATAGVTLREPTQLTISASRSSYPNGYHVSCYQCFNGSITITPSGGIPSYTFLWSDGPTTQNRSSIGGGTYVVTITDLNGCTSTVEMAMTEPDRDDWTTAGNSTTGFSGTPFIGTTSNSDLIIKTNATERMRMKANGYVGIGTNNPTAMLDVNGDAKMGGPLTVTNLTPTVGSDPCVNFIVAGSSGNLMLLDPNACTNVPVLFWTTTGNALPNNTGKFIGTVSNHDFRIRTNDIERAIVKADGKVGIGTASPSEKLHVEGGNIFINGEGQGLIVDAGGNKRVGLMKYSGIEGALVHGSTAPLRFGQVTQASVAGGTFTTEMIIDNSGRVGIGMSPPSSGTYKLYVETGIATRDVLVKTGTLPDYVFEENYSLRSLSELEKFIKVNKHLPEIPSAKEVERNEGFELGDMQTRLLKKIEELTLYIIEQNKRIESLEKKVSEVSSTHK